MIGTRSKARIAEINVTPMADVVIVLLIIFMVTVPMIDDGAVRRLPEATHTRPVERGPLVVSVAADASVFVGDSRMATARELSERVRAELLGSRERVVQVRADASLPYAEIARILEVCRAAGAAEVAFIARPRTGV